MKNQMTDRELISRLETLPREVSPENDVWPVISSRIERQGAIAHESGTSNRWWYRAAAASIALAITAGIMLEREWTSAPGVALPQIASAEQGQMIQSGALSGVLAASEAQYQAAFREFISVGDAENQVTSQTIEKLTAGWTDMRESEAGLSAALQQDPNSLFLNKRMLELRSRQLRFLKQIAALDKSSRRRMI